MTKMWPFFFKKKKIEQGKMSKIEKKAKWTRTPWMWSLRLMLEWLMDVTLANGKCF